MAVFTDKLSSSLLAGLLSALLILSNYHGVESFVVTRTSHVATTKSTRTIMPTSVFRPHSFDSIHSSLHMAEVDEKETSKLPMLLDPGTKGGALFLSLVLFVVPILFYVFVTQVGGVDGIEAGKWIGVGFTLVTSLLWVSSYIFRVATKDMTYAKQLKDYENAVIAKRLEELDEDEVQALVEDIERDDF